MKTIKSNSSFIQLNVVLRRHQVNKKKKEFLENFIIFFFGKFIRFLLRKEIFPKSSAEIRTIRQQQQFHLVGVLLLSLSLSLSDLHTHPRYHTHSRYSISHSPTFTYVTLIRVLRRIPPITTRLLTSGVRHRHGHDPT